MLHLFCKLPQHNNPLHFGSPTLHNYHQLADILQRNLSSSRPKPPPAPAPVPRVPHLPLAPVPLPKVPTYPTVQLPTLSPLQLHTFPFLQMPHMLNAVGVADPTVAGKIFDPVTGKQENIDSLLRGDDTIIWTKSLANEIGRCAQGLSKHCTAADTIKGSNTIFFIKPSQVPPNRKVTDANFVCTIRPNKSKIYRVRLTVGGDKLDAYQDVRSPAVSITDAKIHLNSIISDAPKGARFCTCDIKDFFLQSFMKIFQYMRIHRRCIPAEVMDEYQLTPAIVNAE